MDVELVAEGASEDDAFNLENNIDDYTAFDGERCGICMDIVIDRGVLDCCQHWFCFTCIDNWATITNLCPLCQNELQSITCVPVYDTIGSSKVDEDLCIGEDDWCIEGKNNTLSFPSYYIDENAVICLDGDGCKIRSGSVTIEEDSNLDTSIACDSCDIWYHAFCVGFDPEGTCENSWLCPRCIAHENPQKSDLSPALGPSTYSHLENATNECLVEAAFSGKVSVSVADAGETAVVISMIDGNQVTEGQSEKASSTLELDDDVKIDTIISSSMANGSKSETPLTEKTCTQPVLEAQELDLGLSQDSSFSLTCTSLGQSELKELSSDKMTKEPTGFHGIIMSSSSLDWPSSTNEPFESSLDLHLGISVGCSLPAGGMKSDLSEDKPSGDLPKKSNSEELPAGKIVPDRKDNVSGNTPSKRKLMDSSDDIRTATVDEETKDRLEPKASTKKVRVERDGKLANSKGQTDGSVSDESQKCNSEKENDAYDIMSIVQGTSRRTFKAHANNNHTEKSSIERQNAAGLRVKKIMRRAAEDKDSSMLVQKLRKEIRDAVHNRSPEEFGENLFDPKLLAAFRTAVAGSVTEPAKISPALVVKAKKLMLQKGKVRENLTKKIYGIGGRRKRAWTRDCEIEFWKHRCLKAGKPEKIETLKSVLNVLRKSSNDTQIKQATEGMATNSILSRLYLADTSVFPRKDDIKPLSDLKSTRPVENKGLDLMEKVSTSSLENHTTKTPEVNKVSAQAGIPASDQKGNKNITGTSVKDESAYNKAHPNKCLQQPSAASLSGSDVNSQKGTIGKSTNVKKDKRKWALEILARKTAATGSNATQAKEADNAILKGNYPLLAQLPVDMRPVMAPSRHNKVPMSVRQAQLYRLTEHFLRKANLPVIRRTADTELAVADAVNIEKEVADRSNSKLVYVNLMSQELLHRADNIKYGMAAESDPSSTSTVPTDRPEQVTSDLSDSPIVEEALRNAGLLADSPPNSPSPHMDKIDDENNFPEKIVNKDPDNVFEMDSHPELDIYGDFEYDLEDEDFIGASALRISSLQQEESKMKVVFSTISSDQSNNAPDLEGHEQTTNVEAQKTPSCLHDCSTDMSIRSSSVAPRTEDGLQQHPVINEGDEEPSAAECEELYGPEKEPLMKRFPDSTVTKPSQIMADDAGPEKCEDSGSNQFVKASESGTGSCVDKLAVANVGHHASAGEHETGCSQTSENGTVKEKPSNSETKKESDSFNVVSKKVEAYIKEHIRPLCKSGVITSEQYRWAVGKTTEKVMKYHTKEKDANFLIKEGEKVKKLAEHYVEAAQKMKRK